MQVPQETISVTFSDNALEVSKTGKSSQANCTPLLNKIKRFFRYLHSIFMEISTGTPQSQAAGSEWSDPTPETEGGVKKLTCMSNRKDGWVGEALERLPLK